MNKGASQGSEVSALISGACACQHYARRQSGLFDGGRCLGTSMAHDGGLACCALRLSLRLLFPSQGQAKRGVAD